MIVTERWLLLDLVMPPKKKKVDVKRKEKKISKKSFGGPQAQDQLTEQSREYYLTQIKDLGNGIDRFVLYQTKVANMCTYFVVDRA